MLGPIMLPTMLRPFAWALKLHEDLNDSYSNVHVLFKTPELKFPRYLKTTAEKWPGGCIPTLSDCIL